jgi:hypothetical protein
MNIVTIMNYPDSEQYNKMCCLFIESIFKNNTKCNIFVLYDGTIGISKNIVNFVERKYETLVKFIPLSRKDNAFINTHNINFKLYNLTKIKEPFIFIDADTVCLGKLDFLWERRNEKPFIGCLHQRIPKHLDGIKDMFLNSGVQIVGDTSWYDWDKISDVHYKIGGRYTVKGFDQAIIHEYCKYHNYDYTHPDITPAWNSCAGYTEVTKVDGKWTGKFIDPSGNEDLNYKVFINHYWDEFKPWIINCPIYNSFDYGE